MCERDDERLTVDHDVDEDKREAAKQESPGS